MFFIKYGLETKGTLAPRVLDILFCFWGFFFFFPLFFLQHVSGQLILACTIMQYA